MTVTLLEINFVVDYFLYVLAASRREASEVVT